MTSKEAVLARARQHALGDLPRRTAGRAPDKLAIIAEGKRLSYAEYESAINRAAHALSERGLRKGDRLALVSRNNLAYAVLTFATAKLGIVLVPVNFMLTAEEVAYILGHSGATGIVAEAEFGEQVTAALARTEGSFAVRGWVGDEPPADWERAAAWWAEGPDDPPDVAIADDDPLRLMYTSGTESRPKGVLHTSRSLISQYSSCAIDGEMSPDDVEVHALPMYHCAQLDCFFSTDVYLGASSIILPGPDPAKLLATIAAEGVTKLFCPPTVWISLLRHPDFEACDLSSLRKGYYGASAMPVEVLRELRERLPDVRLWNFYGQTELAPLATILRPHEQLERAGSAGRPAINVETQLFDEDDQPVAAGEVGEIVHRSPHVTLGYYQDEAKTAEAFRGGWFHSGDLGVFDEDGYLTVVDRKKDMIKTGGENVASREVEEAIYTHSEVAEVAVFGIPHPHWIEAVTAAVVGKPGAELTEEGIKAHLADRLAKYKQPKHVLFVDALPKNPSGKIMKRELRAEHGELAES